jgi:uncharacterized protein (TIGR02145 family)
VKIINTYTKATYNISTCEFSDYESMTSITPNGEWSISGTNLTGKRVLLLPQIVDAGRTLAVVTIGAKSYSASLQSSYTFESGTSLNLVVDCEPSSEVNNSHCNVSNWIEGGTVNLKPEAIDEYDALYPDEMDFDDVPVKYVMIGYTNVAQICRELLWRGDEPCQALVLYPMKENKADLTNGLLLRMIGVDADEHGGKISWNKDTNTYTYTDGTHPAIDKLYFRQDGTYSTLSSDDDVWIGTRSANYIDLRADTAYYYNLVKIGTQYWFSEDLHATKYTDGSNITHKKTSTSLSSSAAGYFLSSSSGGYLYNKKSIAGGKLISTKECHIATYGDWSTLKSYLHKNSALIKYGAKWGSSSTLNLSGFSAIATGYYADDGSKATLVSDGSAAAYWSMGYSQTEPWETSVMISTESDDFGEVLPSDYCGYSVRCVMN